MGFFGGRGGPRLPFSFPTWPVMSAPPAAAPCDPAPQQPVAVCAPDPTRRTAQLVDGFYSMLPPDEVSFLERNYRVAFNSSARIEDGSGDILQFDVPATQTFIVTGLDLYADAPDGVAMRFRDGDLRGSLAFALLVDGRVPMDLYSSVDIPTAPPDPSGAVRGSYFSGLGRALGRAGDSPFVRLRAREGAQVRVSYAVLRQPQTPVGHVGAILRGFVLPSALLDKNSA
jgi:hypothetical protein